jgi:integrase
MASLKKWLEIRGEDDCPYMFVTNYGGVVKQVSENTFNQWATRLFTPLLGRRFHPHALREARATVGVVEDGKSLESMQRLLGHKSSETTKTYVCIDNDLDPSDELFVDD